MSDARPITNITDYVCGSCWNSFGRDEPGVLRGDTVVCPHCGHALPTQADVAHAVTQAPSARREISETFGTVPGVAAEASGGFPELESDYGWLPPDMRAEMAAASSTGYVAGEIGDDFDFNEPTLRPDANHAQLLELVRSAPSRPDSSDAWAGPDPGFVAGDELEHELGADVNEPTPLDSDARVRDILANDQIGRAVVVADTESADALNDLDLVALDTPAGTRLEDLEAAVASALSGADAADDGIEHRDWKLKASGLTYNFHGLDALLNWASNKAGQTLAVSIDGVVWKDFGHFFEGIKAGEPAQKAFDDAAAPGAAPAPAPAPATTRATRTQPTQGRAVAAPELATAAGKPAVAPADDKVPAKAPDTQQNPAVAPARSTAQLGGGSIAPASSPSRRVPAASPRAPAAKPTRQAEPASPAKVAVAVAVIAVVVLALLHVQGVFRIPGLPF